jgi:hypothetical protein
MPLKPLMAFGNSRYRCSKRNDFFKQPTPKQQQFRSLVEYGATEISTFTDEALQSLIENFSPPEDEETDDGEEEGLLVRQAHEQCINVFHLRVSPIRR